MRKCYILSLFLLIAYSINSIEIDIIRKLELSDFYFAMKNDSLHNLYYENAGVELTLKLINTNPDYYIIMTNKTAYYSNILIIDEKRILKSKNEIKAHIFVYKSAKTDGKAIKFSIKEKENSKKSLIKYGNIESNHFEFTITDVLKNK